MTAWKVSLKLLLLSLLLIWLTFLFIKSVLFLLFVRKITFINSGSCDCIFNWISFEHKAGKNIFWTLEMAKYLQTDGQMLRKDTFNIFDILIFKDGYHNPTTAATTPSMEPLHWSLSVQIHRTSTSLLSANFLVR